MEDALRIVTKYNKTFISLRNEFGDVLPFQMGIFALSGHGKGLASEFIVEWWRKSTKGTVIYIADPKAEGEATYCAYKPDKEYHVRKLKEDGAEATAYNCKIYHPFTFNIPKSYLPDIKFFSIPISKMSREQWSILAETSWDSEAIKLMLREGEKLKSHEGMFRFLTNISQLVTGKTGNKKKF